MGECYITDYSCKNNTVFVSRANESVSSLYFTEFRCLLNKWRLNLVASLGVLMFYTFYEITQFRQSI